jgi:hypothetical protein
MTLIVQKRKAYSKNFYLTNVVLANLTWKLFMKIRIMPKCFIPKFKGLNMKN